MVILKAQLINEVEFFDVNFVKVPRSSLGCLASSFSALGCLIFPGKTIYELDLVGNSIRLNLCCFTFDIFETGRLNQASKHEIGESTSNDNISIRKKNIQQQNIADSSINIFIQLF